VLSGAAENALKKLYRGENNSRSQVFSAFEIAAARAFNPVTQMY